MAERFQEIDAAAIKRVIHQLNIPNVTSSQLLEEIAQDGHPKLAGFLRQQLKEIDPRLHKRFALTFRVIYDTMKKRIPPHTVDTTPLVIPQILPPPAPHIPTLNDQLIQRINTTAGREMPGKTLVFDLHGPLMGRFDEPHRYTPEWAEVVKALTMKERIAVKNTLFIVGDIYEDDETTERRTQIDDLRTHDESYWMSNYSHVGLVRANFLTGAFKND